MYCGVYSGSVKQNDMHGHGTLKDLQGNTYKGAFRGNLKHGRGVLTLADGRVLDGHFVKDFASHGSLPNIIASHRELLPTKCAVHP